MQIVDAVWEKRNLGVDCCEIKLEQSDRIEDFLEAINRYEKEYTVVKVPSNMPEYIFVAQENGYQYVENILSLYHNNVLPQVNSLQERLLNQINYSVMDGEQIDKLFVKIRSGMFSTDRIAIDPEFSVAKANERYIGWLKDEIKRGTKLYEMTYKDRAIGFFSLRDAGNGIYVAPLAGIYQDVTIPGIGIAMDYFEIYETNKCGGKKVFISVSSNNRGAFTIPLALGFSLNRIETVFIKHLKDNKKM